MYAPFAVVSLLAALAHGYAAPEGCSGVCTARDPGLMRRASDGVYFRFSTFNQISSLRADALQGPWTEVGSVLPGGSSIDKPGRNDLWAPDLRNINGVYHLYYSVSTSGSRDSAIGLATSDSMAAGSWQDHGTTGIETTPADNYNAIDANLLDDGGGAYYLTFGSFWGGIYQVKMNAAADQRASDPYNLAYEPAGNHPIEGAYLYKDGGFYYLFFSAGQCCGFVPNRPAPGAEYHIKVCRSSSPTGNFVDQNGTPCTNGGGTVVLASHGDVYAPGGQGVYNDPEHGPVLYYHYLNATVGFEEDQKLFGWNTIDFSSGWPVV